MNAGWGAPAGIPYPGAAMVPGIMATGLMFPYGPYSGGLPIGYPMGPADPAAYEKGADALAERLEQLQLGTGYRGGRGYNQRGGAAGPSGGLPSYYGFQQQQQHSQSNSNNLQQQQQQRGRPNGGGIRAGQGRQHSIGPNSAQQLGGRGQQQQPQQQKKKRLQKGMEDNVKRTVYISYVDHQVTEEMLAGYFADCGKIMDCRICGDPNSAMRFAFIEFMEVESATKALEKTGTMLGSSPLRVLPSKTAIVPVNRELMPRSNDEIERCSRTVYAANIDKKVDKNDVKAFFESLCGKVSRIRLLGDYAHTTRIAFVEFLHAEGALAALNCSGALLGSLPIRVSPSKTPVRIDAKEDSPADAAPSPPTP